MTIESDRNSNPAEIRGAISDHLSSVKRLVDDLAQQTAAAARGTPESRPGEEETICVAPTQARQSGSGLLPPSPSSTVSDASKGNKPLADVYESH
ncbi:hypothetical protein EV182_005735, partial [Spiromyces aspiralis]